MNSRSLGHKGMLLALETSCDESAVALMDLEILGAGGSLLEALRADFVSSQTKLHEAYGGVVPELAAREHIANLPLLVQEACKKAGITPGDVRAIAVTRGPGLNGCLLVGLCYAKAFAWAQQIPLLALNHIEAHIFAGELMPVDEKPELPMVALVVSGGHTMLVHISEFRRYTIIAKTRDDAAGEAFDKAAAVLGLPYPGGPSLSKCAEGGDARAYPLPVGLAKDYKSFSFSGLKTALARAAAKEDLTDAQTVKNLSASLQAAIVKALTDKSAAACRDLKPRSFLLTGGVAANQALRASLHQEITALGIKFCVPDRRWCTDNAAMLAALAFRIIEKEPQTYLSFAGAGAMLGPETPYHVHSLPRWPIDQL